MIQRPRRNRKSAEVRALVRETHLLPQQLIYPVFVKEGQNLQEPIPSLPGQFRWSPDKLPQLCSKLTDLGVGGIALFPAIDDSLKNSQASEALNPQGLIPRTIQIIKDSHPDTLVITDIALDPFNSDGHDGLVIKGEIDNDQTLPILAEMATLHASCGADFVAPSDMMDGRVLKIRKALDTKKFSQTGIISYSAKYASSLYGPFRDALSSAPKAGDKKTYQMDPANSKEALREALLDIKEGADIIMVKPATYYLDIIQKLSQKSTVPVAAYHVSGEYAMLKLAEEKGLLQGETALLEALISIKRAGAQLIFTYGAMEVAKSLWKYS